MANTAVYRVQHREDGSGPYFGSRAVGSSLDYSPLSHPEPQDDGIGWKSIRADKLCGFQSIEAVLSWFSQNDLKFLHSMGFILAAYSVAEKKIARGNSQLLFPEDSELISTGSLAALLPGQTVELAQAAA